MWDLRAAFEISQTALGAASCLYFVGAQFKKTKVRGYNRIFVVTILVVMLLSLLAEQCLTISAAGTVPDLPPFAAAILYMLALISQIDRLCPCTAEENNTEPAWPAFFGSWTALFMSDIIKLSLTARKPDLVCIAFAIGVRCIMELILFAMPAKPGGAGMQVPKVVNSIRGTDNSVVHEMYADGGFWPWLKKFQIFLPWIWPSGVPWIKACLLANLALQLSEIGLRLSQPRLHSAFVSRLEQAYAHREYNLVWLEFSLPAVVYLLIGGLVRLRSLLWQRLKSHQTHLANESIHRHLMDHEATFHDKINSNDILMAADHGLDILQASDFLVQDVVPCITQFVITNLQIGAIYNPHVALIQISFTVLDILIHLRMGRAVLNIQDAIFKAKMKTRRRREEGLKSWRTVKVFGQIDHEISAYTTLHDTEIGTKWRFWTREAVYLTISSWILTVGKFAAMALAILHNIETGGVVGDVLALDMYWNILQHPMSLLTRILPLLLDQLGAGSHLHRLLEIKPKMKYGAAELHLTEGRITFKNVSFGYTGTDGKAKLIFRHLNLTIQPGKATAIVGPSGVGKTTIANLITRLYDPDEGSVEIDGQDIKSLKKEELQKHVTFMGQTLIILDVDFETNIKFGRPDATIHEMQEAAERACIHARIMKEDEHYHAMVGEGGKMLSGGEKQRLVLARTLIRKKPIMFFDEPTSALDGKSEAHALKGIEAACTQSTTITIAHRLSSIINADHILVLGKGDDGCSKIIEEGSHEELEARGGAYARLWHSQTGGVYGGMSGRSSLKNGSMRERGRSNSL